MTTQRKQARSGRKTAPHHLCTFILFFAAQGCSEPMSESKSLTSREDHSFVPNAEGAWYLPRTRVKASDGVMGSPAAVGFEHRGQDEDYRPYPLLVPRSYDGTQEVPLVVLLHGWGASGRLQKLYFGFGLLARLRGFLLAYPDGTLAQENGSRFWNASDACCDVFDSGVDDVAYLSGLIEDVRASYRVDPNRIFLVGHSNGGFMAHRMACERPDLVTGIVSLAGAAPSDDEACEPSQAVSVLQVHGTDDDVITYDDGEFNGYPHPGAHSTVARWAQLFGCTAPPLEGPRLNLVPFWRKETSTVEYQNCDDDVRVALWTMDGVGHIPRFIPRLRWANAIYDWLLESVDHRLSAQ